MRRIALRTLPDSRGADPIDYRSIIEQCLRVPIDKQKGASIEEMRRSIRVLDALEAAHDDVLQLEDADWEHLKQKIEVMPWAIVDRRIVTFYDDVMGATDVVPLNGQLLKVSA